MDRKLARRNLRFGLSLFAMLFVLVGVTFLWASIYLGVIK
jgi:hypothetical protein